MATAIRSIKGFKVTCPHCGSEDETVTIDLNDLGRCECSCGETFSARAAAETFAAAARRREAVARGVEMAGEALDAE